ncbi:MAG: hypothetical protein M1281_14910 [Chloroflexi bacterium]|nr:hypothetical protein [Chloroflexota bacterium]
MIKLKHDIPHVEVSQPFIEAIQEICRYRIDVLRQEIASASSYARARVLEKNRYRIAKLEAITLETGGRFGLDGLVTTLKKLPYEKFGLAQYKNDPWLAATTRPITIPYNGHTYEMGRYTLLMPVADARHGSLERLHMIPMKAPKTAKRHPHHVLRVEGPITDPLAERPWTCWSEFSSVIMGMIQDADFPEFYRMLHIFLSRYNERSPIPGARLPDLPFPKVTRMSDELQINPSGPACHA